MHSFLYFISFKLYGSVMPAAHIQLAGLLFPPIFQCLSFPCSSYTSVPLQYSGPSLSTPQQLLLPVITFSDLTLFWFPPTRPHFWPKTCFMFPNTSVPKSCLDETLMFPFGHTPPRTISAMQKNFLHMPTQRHEYVVTLSPPQKKIYSPVASVSFPCRQQILKQAVWPFPRKSTWLNTLR